MNKGLLVLTILLLLASLATCCWGEESNFELKHTWGDAIGDLEMLEWGSPCIESEEHLWIDLSQKDWNRISGANPDFKRQTHFSASLCIKCRAIRINCCGNDEFKYRLKTPNKLIKDLESRIQELEAEEYERDNIKYDKKGNRIWRGGLYDENNKYVGEYEGEK